MVILFSGKIFGLIQTVENKFSFSGNRPKKIAFAVNSLTSVIFTKHS